MVDSSQRSTRRRRGRRGKQGVTRQRLIDVTIELVRSDGLSALTTSRIAGEAGIAQPGFYAHFKNVEACLQAAATQVIELIRSRQREARRRSLERIRSAADLTNLANVRASYADAIEVMLQEQRFAEFILRYRRDTSSLGSALRVLMSESREELVNDLWRVSRQLGSRPEHYPRVAFWAEEITSLYVGAVEALIDGRFTDKEMIFDTLAQHTVAILEYTMREKDSPIAPMPRV